MTIIGIDPGMGVKSNTGVVAIDINRKSIKHTCELEIGNKNLQDKLSKIPTEIYCKVDKVLDSSKIYKAYIESFVMRGKGGQSLQRLIGVIMSSIDCPVVEVPNTTVKKQIGGKGSDDKVKVAEGVKQWVEDETSKKIVDDLVERGLWDRIDAAAIAIAGFETDGE